MQNTLATYLMFTLCIAGSYGCDSTNNNTDAGSTPDPTADMATPDPVQMDGGTTADLAQVQQRPTEVLVVRVGSGTGALASNIATAAFVERRLIGNGSLVGQALALPTAASGTNRPLTLSGTGSSEGALTRSVDGRYVLIAGYDAAPGTASVIDNALRVVGRLATDGTLDTSTTVDGLNGNGNPIRSAISTDGNAIWLGGVLGVAYTTFGSTGMPAAKPLGSVYNSRVLGIFGSQLYVSRASDTSGGINAVGTGLPMTNNVSPRQLTGFPSTGNVLSPYGFLAFDRDGNPGIDVLYVADDRTDGNGGVQKWTMANNTWTLAGTTSVGVTSGCRGLAGFAIGTETTLVATTSELAGSTRLVSLVDNGGPANMMTVSVLATAATNTAFRGVSLPPTP